MRGHFGKPEVSYQKVKRSVGRGDLEFVESFFSADYVDKALKQRKKAAL